MMKQITTHTLRLSIRLSLLLTLLTINSWGQNIEVGYSCTGYPYDSLHSAYCAVLNATVDNWKYCFDTPSKDIPGIYDDVKSATGDGEIQAIITNIVKQTWNNKCDKQDKKGVEATFMYLLRLNPTYIRDQFTGLVKSLFPAGNVPDTPILLIPGAGILFELPSIVDMLNPKEMLAIDPNPEDIKKTDKLMQYPAYQQAKDSIKSYYYKHGYIGKPYSLCSDMGSRVNVLSQVDAALFINPGILIQNNSLSDSWKSIFDDALNKLKPGGHGIFILQSKLERDHLKRYLANKKGYKAPVSTCTEGEFFSIFHDPSLRFYTCGVRVQKIINEPIKSVTSHSEL